MQLGANTHSFGFFFFNFEVSINYTHTYIYANINRSLFMHASILFYYLCKEWNQMKKVNCKKTENGTMPSIHNYDALLWAMKALWQT